MNSVILWGHLGQDPEVRVVGDSMSVASFSVATKGREKGAGGWGPCTDWHRVVCFGKTAELAGQYLRKGSGVTVRGELKTRKWTGKDGTEKWTTEVVASEVEFTTPKGAGGQDTSASRAPANRSARREVEDDVPF